MTMAVCFKCGGAKAGPFVTCQRCKVKPEAGAELTLSLALSEHLASQGQLAHFAYEIGNHLKITVPDTLLGKAREALKDPQLLAMLRARRPAPQPAKDTQPTPKPAAPAQQPGSGSAGARRNRSLPTTHLHRNPFALLGVTTRDDRRRIVEVAEEKSLELDHDECQKARSDLTSPRTRLSAEMAWLPGISPRKASQLLEALLKDPMSIREEPSGLPTLAHLNLMAAAFEAVDGSDTADYVADFIQEMAYLVDDLSPDQVLRDINEDRSVSGFPEVRGVDQVEAELVERKRYYRNAIKEGLNRLPPASLVDAMTAAVDETTSGGEHHAPALIDDLVDSYAVETQGFLREEAENAQKLIDAARASAKSGESAVKPIVDKLGAVARNWDRVAQPIQLSARARGINHEPSHEIAYSIRSLAVDLFNEYDMLTQSQRLTALAREIFAEVPEISDRVEQDAEALADIFQNRKEAEAQRKEWAREITYRTELGVIFKDALSISPDGVTWKNQHYALDAVTRLRWGGIRHSAGTTFTIAFGDNRSEAVVTLKKEASYSTFLEKLWRAVGFRLLAELYETLKAGKEVRFGEATVRDDSVTLIKHKFLGANESVRCPWQQVQIWTADGVFYIGAKNDKKVYVGFSYLHEANIHILEQAIRMAFKKPGMRRLSDVLQ